MTSYSGPLTGTIFIPLYDPAVGPNGEVEGTHESPYVQSFLSGTMSLTEMAVDADGNVTGVFAASGRQETETRTAQGISHGSADFVVPPTPFETTLAGFNLALPTFGAVAVRPRFSWTGFGDGRFSVAVSQSWNFDFPDPAAPSGTVVAELQLSGTLAATSSAYRVTSVGSPAWEGLWDTVEGSGGTTRVGFVVERRGGLERAASVAWSVEALSAADAGDFTGGVLPSGVLAFAPGQSLATAYVDVGADNDYEILSEEFRLVLAVPPGELLANDPLSGVISIRNDDAIPVVGIAPLDADKPEGNEGATALTFLLTRTGNTLGQVDIPWHVSTDWTDLTPGQAASGTVHFAEGETEHVLSVEIAGDRVAEPDRRVWVSLDYDWRYQWSNPVALGWARADDTDIADIAVAEAGSGAARVVEPAFYYGPVPGVEKELILITPENLNVAASGPNWFLHTGSGNDALAAHSGTNVLDGGTGSNFLTGGTGIDHFYIDARGLAAPVWSTALAQAPWDSLEEGVTIWVDDLSAVTMLWEDGLGAPGYEGLTLHVGQPGRPWASLTLPGHDSSQLDGGMRYFAQVGAWTGSVWGEDGSDYIFVSVHRSHVTGL